MLCIVGGCKKFVEVNIPPNQLSSSNVFKDRASIEAVLAGIYSDLSTITHPLNADMHIAASLYDGEFNYAGSNRQYLDFENGNIQTDNSIISGIWMYTYQTIYRVNAGIEGLKNSSIEKTLKSHYLGEFKFLRAFCYLQLVNLFGNVPLITSTEYGSNSTLNQTSSEGLYEQIVIDLKEAQNLLSKEPKVERARPNYFTACALLARVYLYLENWKESEEMANIAINNLDFQLVDLSQVFLKESKETIWQLIPVYPSYNTNIGRILVPTSLVNNTIPDYYISNEMTGKFEEEDDRSIFWVGKKIVANESYFFPYKYKIKIGSTLSEYLVVFRLAEQYLIRAEALAAQGRLKEANDDINKIRNRAGLSDIDYNDKGLLLNEIKAQRALEFFGEWGLTWFDKKRNDQIGGLNKYWPIPRSQMEDNPTLVQNKGY